ncbi:hypothetical protein ACQEVB_40680 [Pseudonocardia sp. CA-107938]|uniref:hypothetical protein n=1 Tax=Pseudonocardia sp. CA-107938 TaxID=3240021 RepID=UPI003D930CE8
MTSKDNSVKARIRIGGDASGQIAVGNRITQTSTRIERPEVSDAELAELQALINDLRTRIATEAPPERRDGAVERVDELAEAITAEQPDIGTVRYVLNWFRDKIGPLAGAVRDLVLNPLVAKVVGAAGDVAAKDLERLLHDVMGA